jgi:hypothetical protein
MGHCEYTTGILVPPTGVDCGCEFGYTQNPLPPPQLSLAAYKPTMWAALQIEPIVITHVHLRMYPEANATVRPGYGAGMSANIDKNLNWYMAGGNIHNQTVAIPDDDSMDLGALLYDPQNASLQAYFDWSGCPPKLTKDDGLVLSAVNFAPGGGGKFVAIWDFDYLPLSEWTGPSS